MKKGTSPERLAPSIDATWRDEFVVEMRLLGVTGSTIAEALVEVETHCVDSGERVTTAFGPAKNYAKALGLPDETRWTTAEVARTWMGLLLIVGGFGLSTWGAAGLLNGEAAVITVGSLVSGGVTLALMVLIFVFGDRVLRLVTDHIWWAALSFVAAIGVVVAAGLPFDDNVLGSVSAWVPFLVGAGMFAAWGAWTLILRRAEKWLDDPLVPPTRSLKKTH